MPTLNKNEALEAFCVLFFTLFILFFCSGESNRCWWENLSNAGKKSINDASIFNETLFLLEACKNLNNNLVEVYTDKSEKR